jgi:hypothetical protein
LRNILATRLVAASAQLVELKGALNSARICLRADNLTSEKLMKLRNMYEGYAYSLSTHFMMALPKWLPKGSRDDNWMLTTGDHSGGPFAVSDPFRGAGQE